MIRTVLFWFGLLIAFSAHSQNDTIRIQKSRNSIYKCINNNALSWYIRISNQECILADLKINPNEIENWFDRFANSQNIYRAAFHENDSTIFYFNKSNDPMDALIFHKIHFSTDQLKLEIQPSGEVFVFNRFEL